MLNQWFRKLKTFFKFLKDFLKFQYYLDLLYPQQTVVDNEVLGDG